MGNLYHFSVVCFRYLVDVVLFDCFSSLSTVSLMLLICFISKENDFILLD